MDILKTVSLIAVVIVVFIWIFLAFGRQRPSKMDEYPAEKRIVAHDSVDHIVSANSSIEGAYELLPSGQLRTEEPNLSQTKDMSLSLNKTPVLLLAALQGDITVLRKILHNGADVNAVDSYGQTALMVASWRGDSVCVQELLNHKADIRIKDWKGQTAVTWAKTEGHDKVALLLQDAGGK